MGNTIRNGLTVVVCLLATMALSQGGRSLGRPAKSIGKRVMAIGDSITLGAGSQGGYRILLESRLMAEGYKFEFVGSSTENSKGLVSPNHEGHGGWSTTDITSGKPGQGQKGKMLDWLTKHKPDTVLLMTGTNDSVWVTKQEWTAKYQKMLDVVFKFNPKMKVVLAAIPRSDSTVTGKDWGEAMCFDVVKSVVANRRSRGFMVTMADCYTSFNVETDLSDAYHPNQNGYRKIANAFYSALVRS